MQEEETKKNVETDNFILSAKIHLQSNSAYPSKNPSLTFSYYLSLSPLV